MRNPERCPLVTNILERVEPNAYNLSEWMEEIAYITGEGRGGGSSAGQKRVAEKIKTDKNVHTG